MGCGRLRLERRRQCRAAELRRRDGFVRSLVAEDEAGERADGEGDEGADEDVPGEGDVRDGQRDRECTGARCCCQSKRLRAKPETMPMMAPVWVA